MISTAGNRRGIDRVRPIKSRNALAAARPRQLSAHFLSSQRAISRATASTPMIATKVQISAVMGDSRPRHRFADTLQARLKSVWGFST